MEIKSQKDNNNFIIKKINISKDFLSLYKDFLKEMKNKNNEKIISNSFNEKIYSNYSQKLGEYYHKNKNDLYLYGSQELDLLAVDNLVEKMKQNKNNVIRKIRQSPNKYRNIGYCSKRKSNNVILTPLAEKESEKSLMGRSEKEQFNTAERMGVVMRRIEYSYLLDQNGQGYNENNKILFEMKDAVEKNEKCWQMSKRRIVRGLISLKKYFKRKIFNLLFNLNIEKFNISMSHNSSLINYRNDLELKSSQNNKLKNYNNNNDNYDYKIEKPLNNNNNSFFNHKILEEELNQYKNENLNLKNKINDLTNEIDDLKNQKKELIQNYENIIANYNKLLQNNKSFNESYVQMKLNNETKSVSSQKETEESLLLLNKYNDLNDRFNNLLKENESIKNKYEQLNNNINLLNNDNNKYVNEIELLKNKINEYENKIRDYESKEINIYQKQINELQNINSSNEKKILSLEIQIEKSKEEIIKSKQDNKMVDIMNENNNLKKDIDCLKSDMIKLNKNLEENKLKINKTENKLNLENINNNKLIEENKISKTNRLNNLINELNLRIKKLIEENKYLKKYKDLYLDKLNRNIFNKLFILFLDVFFKQKILEYKYQFILGILKININNFSKYIVYQNNSEKNSLNFDGYEKVIIQERTKINLSDNDQSKELRLDEKIVIHPDIDDE